MKQPDYVVNFERPSKTGIKHIHGGWYLYERHHVYDSEKKTTRRVWGKYLGRITGNGLVPKEEQAAGGTPPQVSDVVEAFATQYCYDLTGSMRDELRLHFPDDWKQIYAIAVLRATSGPRFRNIEGGYAGSILSRMYPGLALSASSISRLLADLGRRRVAMVEFMKDSIHKSDDFVIVDGHRILTGSKTMETAEVGYDSKMRCKPQINVLHMFSRSLEGGVGFPAFYEQFAGNTVDVSALRHMIDNVDALPEKCMVIGDKGCGSSDLYKELDQAGLLYEMPPRRGSRFFQEIDGLPSRFEMSFSYRRRPIRCKTLRKDGFNIHVFYDGDLYNDEFRTLQESTDKVNAETEKKRRKEEERRAKGKGRLSDKDYEALVPRQAAALANQRPEMGTITIRTNAVDLPPEAVYAMYKQRGLIEDFFKSYDCTLGFDSSYMRSSITEEAWLFLNHLSATICILAMESLRASKETRNVSWDSLRVTLGRLRVIRMQDGQWIPEPITRKTRKLLDRIGLDPDALSVLQIHGSNQ